MSVGNPDAAFGVKLGDRVRLDRMGNDPDPVTPGTTGTVTWLAQGYGLDQICVDWDNGRSLALIPGSDKWTVIGHDDDWDRKRSTILDRIRNNL